jgi:hypothetical protein
MWSRNHSLSTRAAGCAPLNPVAAPHHRPPPSPTPPPPQKLHEVGARAMGLCIRHMWFFELFNLNLATNEEGETPASAWDRMARSVNLSPEQVGVARRGAEGRGADRASGAHSASNEAAAPCHGSRPPPSTQRNPLHSVTPPHAHPHLTGGTSSQPSTPPPPPPPHARTTCGSSSASGGTSSQTAS